MKWTENPAAQDTRHLQTFLDEYPRAKKAVLVARVSRKRRLTSKIEIWPWQDLPELLRE